MLRPTLLAALLSAAIPITALAQTADELKNDEKTPGDVLVYGMGYSGNRYSPLTQINKQNISRLVPVWAYSLSDLQGGESSGDKKKTAVLPFTQARLRCAAPCRSQARATWQPSRYRHPSQAAFAPSARSRCLSSAGRASPPDGPLEAGLDLRVRERASWRRAIAVVS